MFDGSIHRPGRPGYDSARANWRGLDSRPKLVVEAGSARDVAMALRLASEEGLAVAVQNTGHGVLAPHGEDTLLIRTTRLREVTVDPGRRTARAEAGVLLLDVIRAAAPYGLTPLFGSTPWLGAAGYVLGGGVGPLTRLYGYAADSLLAADVATPDGRVVPADEALLWGLRGAGGCLAVATAIEIRLHPVRRFYSGVVAFGRTDLFRLYRDWTPSLPPEMSTALVLLSSGVTGLRVHFHGTAEAAEPLLAPFRAAAGPPVLDTLRPRSPWACAEDAPPSPPVACLGGIELFDRLPDAALAALTRPLSLIEVRHLGGASRTRSGPAGPRDADYMITVETTVDDREGLDEAIGELRRHSRGDAMRNLLIDPADAPRAYTAADRLRLAGLKRRWDPGDLLRTGADGWLSWPNAG